MSRSAGLTRASAGTRVFMFGAIPMIAAGPQRNLMSSKFMTPNQWVRRFVTTFDDK
jgi:hypothetical protein